MVKQKNLQYEDAENEEQKTSSQRIEKIKRKDKEPKKYSETMRQRRKEQRRPVIWS